jgi:hypothetical protein
MQRGDQRVHLLLPRLTKQMQLRLLLLLRRRLLLLLMAGAVGWYCGGPLLLPLRLLLAALRFCC